MKNYTEYSYILAVLNQSKQFLETEVQKDQAECEYKLFIFLKW